MEFYIKQQLCAHELSVHKFAHTHTCEDCCKYLIKEGLDTDIESHYDDIIKYPCPYCDADFPNSNGLRTHLHLIHFTDFDIPEYSTSETPAYQVEYSPIRPTEQFTHLFSELYYVSEHVNNVHIEQVDDNRSQVSFFKDNEDNASSQINLLFDNGYKIDTELNNIPSEDNNKVSYSRIGRHMKKKHNNAAPYQCEICHAQFNRKLIMNDHRRKHTIKKPYKCTECSKCFTRKHHLVRYVKVVHNSGILEKVFCCSVCDKAFPLKEYLTLHVKSRHKDKHFMCYVCGKRFALNAVLKRHQLCHTDERPFVCEHCGMIFKHKSHCVAHKKKKHPGDHDHE